MEIRDLTECTGYSVQEGTGDVQGLHGANCRHNHYAFFEGISQPVQYPPEPESKVINGKTYTYYDMTQGMRRREREIRALKREKEALKALGMDTKEVNAKIRQKTAEYSDFCKQCDLKEKQSRLRVESGTSDLTKTMAWKRYEQQRVAKSNEPGKRVYFNDNKSYRIELSGYSTEVHEGLSKAAREVAYEGGKNSWEHMRLVNLKTGEIQCPHTDKEFNSVGGRVLWEYLKEHPDEQFAFIHNHNTATELSLPDVELMMNEKQLPVVASVRNDGIIYLVESNGKHSNDIPYLRYEKEAEEFSRKYTDKSDQGKYSRDKELLFRNLVIQEFAKGGMKEFGND